MGVASDGGAQLVHSRQLSPARSSQRQRSLQEQRPWLGSTP